MYVVIVFLTLWSRLAQQEDKIHIKIGRISYKKLITWCLKLTIYVFMWYVAQTELPKKKKQHCINTNDKDLNEIEFSAMHDYTVIYQSTENKIVMTLLFRILWSLSFFILFPVQPRIEQRLLTRNIGADTPVVFLWLFSRGESL